MIVLQNLFADLVSNVTSLQTLRAAPAGASFYKAARRGHNYWYAKLPGGESRYIGKVGAPSIEEIIKNERDLKALEAENKAIVKALKTNGVYSPSGQVAKVLAGLSANGVFRLQAVLVGTLAFQTYQPMLGLPAKSSSMATNDIDIAHSRNIAVAINDRLDKPLGEILKNYGNFYRTGMAHEDLVSQWIDKNTGLSIDLIASLAAPWESDSTPIPVLGEKADKLKFLDFLICDALPSAIVSGSGIAVNTPMPERYAVHKLILSQERRNRTKARKDLLQAEILINSLGHDGSYALAEVFSEAIETGPGWRKRLIKGVEALAPDARMLVKPLIPKKYYQNSFLELKD